MREVEIVEPRDAALTDLFRVWREPMSKLAYVLTGDAARADEIVHLVVVRRTQTERPDVATLAADDLVDALAKLDYGYRGVLALRIYCDLSDNEIAEALGIRR